MNIRLPQASKNGICLNYKENGESLLFAMSANMNEKKHPGFYFVASHKGVVLFYKKIEMKDYAQALNLGKNLFPKGISKISLLDSTLNPFAERLIFIDDGMNDNIGLSVNKKEFQAREQVDIGLEAQLALGDSITSTLSVSVVNRNYQASGGNNQTIRSYLLLDSDLKGIIESPDSYFVSEKAIASAEKLDLLMLVQGWKSYFWDELETKTAATLDDWNDAGINISGHVKKLLWKDPVAWGKVTLGPAGGNFLFLETQTDTAGRFEFRQIYLRDSTLIMINAKARNGSRNAEVRLDPVFKLDSVVPAWSFKNLVPELDLNAKFNRENYNRRVKEMGFNPLMGSILLSEVEVMENRIPKDATQFKIYQEPDNSFKITKADNQYNNLIEYLEGKVAGLTVTGDNISIRGGGMPLFLIDGVEVSDFPPGSGRVLEEIKGLHMSEIEKVDILKSGMNMAMFGSKGANGVIAIYRTSGDYTENMERYIRGRITERIKGFNRPSKFYSPQYTLANKKDPTPDFRPTLFWNPELDCKSGQSKFSFFTSDEQAQYDVLVEGITKNGKICFGTTSFLVNKK